MRIKSYCLIVALATLLFGYAEASRAAGSKKKSRLVTRLLDGHLCDVGLNAVSYAKVWFTARGRERLANADFTLSRPTNTISKAEFALVRCSEAISYNNCEYYDTWRFSVGFCSFIKMPNMPWTMWAKSIVPPMQCPIMAGNYTFRNADVDANSLDQFGIPLENTVWIITLRLFDSSQQNYICANYSGEFKRARQ